ncbi:hypothetical protein J7438_06955 [Thalassotalea sp. G20_0]|uniref:hypothetical protein n=1 Tax=Thalassotalea sp. G20_0 TaxID=2821093 RepID=UPI001AD95622|nr:hypothetical protein [Thalassotalea sp. G20_0]MBO9493823.1 hypothetical protein [Thalassotalea sp. G20_0]
MIGVVLKHFEVVCLRGFGVALAVVSTGALVLLLVSLPMTDVQLTMTTITGIALQGCLYLFARSEDVRLQRMGWVLLVGSVIATAAFLESAWQQHVAQLNHKQVDSVASSFTVQQIQREIEDRNRQIDVMLSASEKDVASIYRDRSDKRNDKLTPLYQQRDELMQQLKQQQQQTLSSGAEAGSLQAMLTGVSREARLATFVVMAALIDYTALLALGMVSRTESLTAAEVQQPESVVNQLDSVEWIAVLQQRILSGEFGEHPSQRQMIDEVKQAYEALKDDGRLVKDGQRFRVIGEVV